MQPVRQREPRPERVRSLDVFRGGTIAAMILVNNPGSSAIYPQLRHAAWHGWTFTDLVFPFFLWIAGMAAPYSFARRMQEGASRGKLLLHTARRAALIFLIGLLLNGFPYYNLQTLRIPGVLQRIAVCYLVAAAIYLFTGTRGQIAWIAGLLAVYWLLMMYYPVPGFGSGILEREGNFEQYVDGLFLSGHMYSQTRTWDPEGIVSTLPAIATVLFGVLAGGWLRRSLPAPERTVGFLLTGNLLMLAGLLLSAWMPINKQLWTVSYCLFTAGLAGVVFGGAFWLVDVRGGTRWIRPLQIFGMNALAAYVLSGLLARAMSLIKIGPDNASLKTAIYNAILSLWPAPIQASVIYAALNVIVIFAFAWLLYRRNWCLRV